MSARLDDFAMIEHDNPLCFAHSRKAMRNNNGCFVLLFLDDILKDFIFRNRINGGCWLI